MYLGDKRRSPKFSIFIVSRAIFVRVLFAVHGLTAIWRLYLVTQDSRYCYILFALAGLLVETVFTLYKMKGNEWKWFCPSVFFYLLCVVPAIWFLELDQLDRRILLRANINATGQVADAVRAVNETVEDLSASIAGLGLEIRIPVKLTSDQWLRTLEQILLLFLILGRWLLPKGKLTHDQLSQLLLVYIGTAADIVEFFEAFKEDEVRYNRILCMVILAIWSWSLLQFTMVLTATKARKDQSGLLSKKFNTRRDPPGFGCCTPDVYGIVISILMQDCPFLVLRLLLIFKYSVVSYTNMFFTCKNTLVILLLLYRLFVIQGEKHSQGDEDNSEYLMSESSSRARLMAHSTSTDQYYNYRTRVNLREPDYDPDEPCVAYVVKRHMSNGDVRDEASPLHPPCTRSDPAPTAVAVADVDEDDKDDLSCNHDVEDDFQVHLDDAGECEPATQNLSNDCDRPPEDKLCGNHDSSKLHLDLGDIGISDINL